MSISIHVHVLTMALCYSFLSEPPPHGSSIRVMAIHKAPEMISDNLTCCPKHVDEQRRAGQHPSAVVHLYFCLLCSDRRSDVGMPQVHPACSQFSTVAQLSRTKKIITETTTSAMVVKMTWHAYRLLLHQWWTR